MNFKGGIILLLLMAWQSYALPSVKVRFERRLSAVVLSGFSLGYRGHGVQNLSFSDRPKTEQIQVKLLGKDRWLIQREQQAFEVQASKLMISGQNLQLSHIKKLPDEVILYPIDGAIDVLADVTMDDYMQGVLPSEMPPSWPLEALKAQAVVARSYLMSVIKERRHLHFHVESSVEDQVFDLNKQLNLSRSIRKKLRHAIEETREEYLIYGSKALKAYYHSDCGGRTELPKYVWGEHQGLSMVTDKSCPQSPLGEWKSKVSYALLKQKLKAYFSYPKSIESFSFKIESFTPSGRVKKLEVALNDENRLISSQEFRRLMGFSKVKSTLFKMQLKDWGVMFVGRGYGHGVGMCQWGARSLASKGQSYKQILLHYYPQAQLQSL